mgnify:CR=1 FL=1
MNYHWRYTSERDLVKWLNDLSIHHEITSVQRTWRLFWRCYLIVYREKEDELQERKLNHGDYSEK